MTCQPDPYVWTLHEWGREGWVRSYSIYIENLKLVGSMQRGSNSGQKVKFNHYNKKYSCRGQRSGQVIFNLCRKSKVGWECAERLKLSPKSQIQSLLENNSWVRSWSSMCSLLRLCPTCSPLGSTDICHPLHACGLKRVCGTLFCLILGVFEPDFDVLGTT